MAQDATYLDRIRQAYQGEVYGEALFSGLAERARSRERRDKWRALAQLGFETRARLEPILLRLGDELRPDPAAHKRAARDADRISALRWHDAMDLLNAEVTPFVAKFEALERLGPPEERAVLARVTAHEVALQSFVRLELSGRPGESIRPALSLLEQKVVPSRAAAAC